MNEKILVIVAHADDEVLGCGATIHKHIRNNDDVYVLVLTDSTSAQGKDIQNRHQEYLKALNILGVQNHKKLSLKDNRLDSYPLIEIIQEIEKVKKDYNPNIVYTHSYNDLNIDHQITNKAVLTAFRSTPSNTTTEVYTFDIPSSIEYQSSQLMQARKNYFNSITKEDLKAKVQAMCAYESELHPFPHPRSIENLEIIAKSEGTKCGKELAESFYIEKIIR
ncbi:N-acetylglucosaminylphosphatidylinositol deacetylase [Bacteriovorax sp. BAL6_X]|uniref:PIG-L deacetylase family protein n=1 Tax=Bacteriovorax sp. BAL6_X TaxID=1201290 RepID=UPI00038699F1|nr:PIG-L family deacetylase [Bacteriovorax sp. BAL6_X]EPZ52165.1 N-acetylglucosaminylphosphatidylinositol deacetylase [Bacteriovorax sp. BAL6_X]